MEVLEQQGLKLDKSTWTLVKFGDVVKEPKENSKNPLEDGIGHVVGLEHIEPGNIHLTQFNTLEEATTFTKKFAAGDVLFGRRRAYLKKAAQASFGGICSGDITVFRAKGDLLPELMPFIVFNDKFFDYAVKHSAGGLSPRVKFKDLANYEFLLPPKEEQARLAELLWAMDEVIEKEKKVLGKLTSFRETKREEFLNDLEGIRTRLGDITKLQGGATFKSTDSVDAGIKWLKIANVGFDEIKWDDKSYLPVDFEFDYSDFLLNEGDIVLALTRPILGDSLKVARISNIDSPSLLNQRVGRIKINGCIQSGFLYEHLSSRSFINQMKKELQGTDPPNISNKMYEHYEIILPTEEVQNVIQSKMLKISDSVLKSESQIYISQLLLKSMINQIF